MSYLDVFKLSFSKIMFYGTAIDIKCRSGLSDGKILVKAWAIVSRRLI